MLSYSELYNVHIHVIIFTARQQSLLCGAL